MDTQRLYDIGDNAIALNKSLLIGQEVAFARLPTLDDYLGLPLEEAMRITANASADRMLMVFRGRIETFFEEDDGTLMVKFEDNIPSIYAEVEVKDSFTLDANTIFFWEV